MGFSPVVSGEVIRINLPPLSDEYRQNLIKILSGLQEDVKKTIRHFREESWDEIQEKTKAGEIREDDKFKAKDELQKIVDEYNEKVEKIGERKEKEIME